MDNGAVRERVGMSVRMWFSIRLDGWQGPGTQGRELSCIRKVNKRGKAGCDHRLVPGGCALM